MQKVSRKLLNVARADGRLSRGKRAKRHHHFLVESLESRTLLTYTFAYNPVTQVATAMGSPASNDQLAIEQSAGELYWSENGGGFTNLWGGNTVPATSAVTVEITLSTGGGATLALGGNTGHPGAGGAASNLNAAFQVLVPSNSNDSLTIDDATGTTSAGAANPYTFDTGAVNNALPTITGPGINIQEATGSAPFEGGITFTGSSIAGNMYKVQSVQANEGLSLFTGTNVASVVTVGGGTTLPVNSPLQIESTGTTATTDLIVDDSKDSSSHASMILAGGSSVSTLTGLAPAAISYVTGDLNSLTINTGSSGTQDLGVDFKLGDPIPIPSLSTVPGLSFNAGASSGSVAASHGLSLYGSNLTNPFTSETHNAEDPNLLPQAYYTSTPTHFGDIQLTDTLSKSYYLEYTGLTPVTDIVPSVNYTFNDYGTPDQSFTVADNGPITTPDQSVAESISLTSTPIILGPPNFETTYIAGKNFVSFNAPPDSSSVPVPALLGVVNIPTAADGLYSISFTTSSDGINTVNFQAMSPMTLTQLTGGPNTDLTNITGKGIPSGSVLAANGAGGINTLTYDAGGETPVVTDGALPGEVLITIAGYGTVNAINYQTITFVNTGNLNPPVITLDAINTTEGFQLVNAVAGTFTFPITGVFPTGTILPNGLPATDFTATISWGDGSSTAGTIIQDASDPSVYYVEGTHIYALPGSYSTDMTVNYIGGTITGTLNGNTVSVTQPASTSSLTSPTANAIVTDGLLTVTALPVVGTEGTAIAPGPIATFIDFAGPDLKAGLPNYTATVDFFNSSGREFFVPAADVTITQVGSSEEFTVSLSAGAIVLPEEGTYQVLVSVTDNGPTTPFTAESASQAVIADAQLTAYGTQPTISTTEASIYPTPEFGAPVFSGPVAYFVDGNVDSSIADFTATVDWGDGTALSAGTISTILIGQVKVYVVSGSHTYASTGSTGTYPVQVFVEDSGGSKVTVANTASVAAVPYTITGILNPASDSGKSNLDDITNVAQPNFYGTTAPFANATLFETPVGGGTPVAIGATEAGSNGAWSITSNLLALGTYTITASATDQFGLHPTGPVTITPTLVVDTAPPVVTALSFDRFDATLTVTFQDGLSGMDLASITNSAFYHMSAKPLSPKIHVPKLILPTQIYYTPGALPSDPVVVTVVFNNGHTFRGGRYEVVIDSGIGDTGVQDVAGNALDGNFYGTFPSGDGLAGGDFVVSISTFHKGITLPYVPIGDGYSPPPKGIDPPAGASHTTKTPKTKNKLVVASAGTENGAAKNAKLKAYDEALRELAAESKGNKSVKKV